MKQVKIEYLKCKKRMPNRPPDEIDFGLGFKAALKWVLSTYSVDINEAYDHFPYIETELEDETKKT